MKSSAPAEVSAEFCGIGAPLTAKFVARQRFERRAQRRIADEVVRPGETAAQHQRHAANHFGLSNRAPSSVRTSVAFIAA